MLKKLIIVLLVFMFTNASASEPPAFAKSADGIVKRRALLIACDNFKNYTSTMGACKKNADSVNRIFNQENLGFEKITIKYDTIINENQFMLAVDEAFSDSDADDINIMFISSHGYYENNLNTAALVLSNSKTDFMLTANILESSYRGLAGTNFFLLDACNSGAIIGRGVSGGSQSNKFYCENYKIIASGGGSEVSWYWNESKEGGTTLEGAGYFSSALSHALNQDEQFPADLNRDGKIELQELYKYLYNNHAPSVPQVYPYEDNFVIFSYNNNFKISLPAISNIRFKTNVINTSKPYAEFAFTATKKIIPVYQIVKYIDGKWDFENAKFIYDPDSVRENSIEPIEPGIYTRKIAITDSKNQEPGYALIYVLGKENDKMTFYNGKVLNIQTTQGLNNVDVSTDIAFQPFYGQEMPIIVKHDVPCIINIDVLDISGNSVKSIAKKVTSRPQSINPDASTFVWTGKLNNGEYAPSGKYVLDVSCEIENKKIKLFSSPFEVLELKAPPIFNK